jgi:hypothetical protein
MVREEEEEEQFQYYKAQDASTLNVASGLEQTSNSSF